MTRDKRDHFARMTRDKRDHIAEMTRDKRDDIAEDGSSPPKWTWSGAGPAHTPHSTTRDGGARFLD